MKKLLFAACLAAFCLTSCNNGKNNTQDLANQQNDSLNSIIAQKDSEINDMMGTLNEIQDGLNQISEAEHRKRIHKIDRMRKRHFDFYADTIWGHPESYDLMLSSSHFGIDRCVELITESIANK